MSHLTNPIVKPEQLDKFVRNHHLPLEIQESVRYYAARLTQAAGILLRLPQSITAQANIILFRFWTVVDILTYEFADVSAACIFLASKISASPRGLRSITNVYGYLLAPHTTLATELIPVASPSAINHPETYYLSESMYFASRSEILHIEGQICNALSFNNHVALPYPLAVTYLQTLDAFTDREAGQAVAKRAVKYLNSALLSPQMLYLTHQPNALAVAAVYLAARDCEMKLPDVEWWEVFDVDREELGFLCVAFGSLSGMARREIGRWGKGKRMLTMVEVKAKAREMKGEVGNGAQENEEAQMAKLLDEKVGA